MPARIAPTHAPQLDSSPRASSVAACSIAAARHLSASGAAFLKLLEKINEGDIHDSL